MTPRLPADRIENFVRLATCEGKTNGAFFGQEIVCRGETSKSSSLGARIVLSRLLKSSTLTRVMCLRSPFDLMA